MAHIHGFTPYLYVLAPANFQKADLGTYRAALESRVKSSNGKFEACETHVLGCEYIDNMSTLLGYQFDKKTKLIKIHVAVPTIVPTIRSIMERGFECPGYSERAYVTYESNVPFTLRFMIDHNISGCNWVSLPAGTYSLRPDSSKSSRCQIEADIVYTSLVSHEAEGEWNKVAPVRIMSFDIECMGRKGFFPEPEKDPVIQIANVVTLQGDKKPIIRNVFTLDTCNPIPGAQVLSYTTEQKLLMEWAEFVQQCDPDIMTGYNIQNFDVPYLIKRAKQLKISSHFDYWGRIRQSRVRMRDTTFASSAYGKRENIETTIEGRVMLDMLPYMFRNQVQREKQSNYSCYRLKITLALMNIQFTPPTHTHTHTHTHTRIHTHGTFRNSVRTR
jgi:DNA polymerase delta subunit 1